MNYSKIYNLKTGDKIVEPLFETGLSKHYAIYLGIDANGIEWITENHKFNNVQIITAHQYFSTVKKIDRIEKFKGTFSDRQLLINRAIKLSGKKYDFVFYNCEHFATEILTGESESKQITNLVAGLFALLIISLITRN